MFIRHRNSETTHGNMLVLKITFHYILPLCCTPKGLECRTNLLVRKECEEGQASVSAAAQTVEAFPH